MHHPPFIGSFGHWLDEHANDRWWSSNVRVKHVKREGRWKEVKWIPDGLCLVLTEGLVKPTRLYCSTDTLFTTSTLQRNRSVSQQAVTNACDGLRQNTRLLLGYNLVFSLHSRFSWKTIYQKKKNWLWLSQKGKNVTRISWADKKTPTIQPKLFSHHLLHLQHIQCKTLQYTVCLISFVSEESWNHML